MGKGEKKIISEAVQLAKDNSPYLTQLLIEFPDVADALCKQPAESVFDQALARFDAIESMDDIELIMCHLRVEKRRVHLLIALLDLSGLWDWREATRALTRLADKALEQALRFAARDMGWKGTPDNPVPGLFVIAVGKYGAFELNYSSDIDIIVFFDPERVRIPDDKPMERSLIRLVQKLVRLIDYLNGEGYVFRVDLRLRPDPRSNAIAISTYTAARYYETLGQNWERAAMIKARICAGDLQAGEEFIASVLTPYIWRRNLDYVAIDDIQAMKRQVLALGKHGDIQAAGHHLKLGRGGIREVEFYAQTQQLILGGRHPDLRSIRTEEALLSLAKQGFMPDVVARDLIADYGFLRDLEHRVQMMDDAQTHIAPNDPEQRLALAHLAGFDELASFDKALTSALSRVHEYYSALFPQTESLALAEGNLVFTGVEADPETLNTLTNLGFTRQAEVWSLMAQWLGGRVMATRTQRAREILTRLAPHIIKSCAQTGRPDTAFFQFAEFFTNLRAGIGVLFMFEKQPDFMDSVVTMMAQSPRLSDLLGRQPETIDAMIEPDFYDLDAEALATPYSEIKAEADGLEDVMNAVRRHVREDHFRLSAALLSRRVKPEALPPLFTAIAQAALRALVPSVETYVQRRLDDPDGEFAVLALGKMGSGEMSITSDLDLMVIYKPNDQSDLAIHSYYTKLTQRLISALSVQTEEGGLFEVDMALRPSGGSGPITVSINAFDRYYAEQAWTWEFMALTRARCVYSSSPAMEEFIKARLSHELTRARSRSAVAKDVLDMRARLERDKGPRTLWDIKRAIGGLTDIEFCAQYLQIVHANRHPHILAQSTQRTLTLLQAEGLLAKKSFDVLIKAHEFYSRILQYLAISIQGLFDSDVAPAFVTQGVLDITGFETLDALHVHYAQIRAQVRDVFMDVVK